ncbi:serine protein kinase PrkA [Candidatus Woesearchaeota archaeon]|nr:serine protein kinase PrkA [Candidatus Woesearchaeota archaeon]
MTKKDLKQLYESLDGRSKRTLIPFSVLLQEEVQMHPERVFRDIFHLFRDMVYHYVPPGVDEYPDDPESIGYVNYDLGQLLVNGTNSPFFADRPFANRFMKLVRSLGSQQRKIYLFDGPPGSGKSTLINNLLQKFEQYTGTPEGTVYETVWKVDVSKFNLETLIVNEANGARKADFPNDFLVVPCPSHDNPIVHIPKARRKEFLDGLIEDAEFKQRLFHEKKYEWVFTADPCTICTSLYQTLIDKDEVGSAIAVFDMLFARRYRFSRVLGEGVSVYNPGDEISKKPITNETLQAFLNALFRDSNAVIYLFSEYARTNNGIYVVSDVKGENRRRISELHGIISDSVHKVGPLEEHTTSLFMGLINPDDKEEIVKDPALKDRIVDIAVPYVLDYHTEASIYEHVFGEGINAAFLPRVLENFAKVVVSSRLNTESPNMETWIKNPEKYKRYCDETLMLLKMDIYVGYIPEWLSEEDKRAFDAKVRRGVIGEAESEGNRGFTGRESIAYFGEFIARYARPDRLITMEHLTGFFRRQNGSLSDQLPSNFLEALERSYNFSVLQEVKASMICYNDQVIERDILNYLWAINLNPGTKTKCPFTGETLEVDEQYFSDMTARVFGSVSKEAQTRIREEVQKKYSVTIAQAGPGNLTATELFRSMRERYEKTLKENVLEPFVKSESFKRAIGEYGTPAFSSCDPRVRQDVTHLIGNLQQQYGYTEKGAQEICQYVIEKKLVETFK